MEIATKRSVEKNPADDETTGFIDFICINDAVTIRVYGTILIKYDEFYKFDTNKIKEAMEVLFNEDVKEERGGLIEWVEGSQANN